MNNYNKCFDLLDGAVKELVKLDLGEVDKYTAKELEEITQVVYRGQMLLSLLKEE